MALFSAAAFGFPNRRPTNLASGLDDAPDTPMTPREIIARAIAGNQSGAYLELEQADAIIAALKTASKIIEWDWQPIETAPLDMNVNLWFIGNNAPVPGQTMGAISSHEVGKVWDGNGYRPIAWFTHWKPRALGPGEA